MEAKAAAAAKAVEMISNGMTIGLGSGSTAAHAIRQLGARVRQGLKVQAVATSEKSAALAREQGITVIDPTENTRVDIAIDGADQVDERGNLIKGGGGSLLREKIIAFASRKFYVMADGSKVVPVFSGVPVPVEVVPFGSALTFRHLTALPCEAAFRKSKNQDFVTDNGNFIIDCMFPKIDDVLRIDAAIKGIPGVVETGLFPSSLVTAVLVGSSNGNVREIRIN